MITNKEKYIPIIKITKNLMEAIFKKFDVSYDGKFHERRRKIQELCNQPKWNQVYDELVNEGLWDPSYKSELENEKEKENLKEKEIEIEIEIEKEPEKVKKIKNKNSEIKNEESHIIVNLIKNIIKKIDHLEENQTNMMKLVESQMKTNEQTKTNLKKTTIDFIFEENLKLAAYRSTTRMIVSKILILKAKDSFNQVRYPGRDEASRVAKKCNSLLSKQKSTLMNFIFQKKINNFGPENSEQRKKFITNLEEKKIYQPIFNIMTKKNRDILINKWISDYF
ncbi:hypothetical protein M0812_04547 [Anaeramoeba flamelloides]|uniref:Uncharacterized protein n=1 Tax=Anaeramoeba flamelloides TaxID=1746091 RepID=A0AAV8AF81_9EUKA|nr:hypothetical protein M0812_04547 [Anaeramoeba flamelloides]